MIKAKNLSKKYKDKLAVDDISFEIESGKVTGFLGPNGAGKSTTMRLMLGLDNGSGTTLFDDKKLQDYAEPAKVVGILLEAKAFHPTRTARNHLRVLAAQGGIPDTRVDEVLEMVGLTQAAKRKPGQFSLGMSQRLGIAAALLGNPKYLILDEPANGLDPEGIAWLRQFIKDYARQGNAVFISSHLLDEISQMADNIVVIGKGKLISSDSVDNLVSEDANSFVFIRTTKNDELKALLDTMGLQYKPLNGGISINSRDSDKIGLAAFKAKLPVLELSVHLATLEEAFLDLTHGSEEYKTAPVNSETLEK
jgi:ABC-2 type transport system ATP-binding protein